MQPCFVSVWRAGADEPDGKRFELLEPTPIGRELLGVTDSSVSRAAHAPWLEPEGPAATRLHVPKACANTVLAIEASDFDTLGRGLRAKMKWPVAPGGLRRRASLALGRRASLALLRATDPGDGPCDHLISLPRASRIAPGESVLLEAPALLVVGSGAVCVHPGETVLPNSTLDELPSPASFRLPTGGVTLAAARELDGFLNAPVPISIALGGANEPCLGSELPAVARDLLTTLHTHYAFVPALVDEREPRLVLLYERQDGSARALISDGDIAEWLRDVESAIRAAERPSRTPASSTREAVAADGDATVETDAEPRRSEPPSLSTPASFGLVQTLHPPFAQVLAELARAAEQELTVLLLGESGTGKEHLSKALHAASPRAKGPFVAVNCALIDKPLMASALFGHKRGAFSGADSDRDGFFVTASGGTLLLDEIGDAPMHVQLALLRALEERKVNPVGSDREVPVDVRVIAATSRDVRRLLQEGALREDLYFRIAELTVTLPPLRERLVDLPLLSRSLLDAMGCELPLTKSALVRLSRHGWPGNIRELRNALRRAVAAVGDARTLGPELFERLDPLALPARHEPAPFPFPDVVRGLALHALEEGALPAYPMKSQYEQRALQRAALLYMAETQASLPAPFTAVWERLFRPSWATAQEGRGLKELLRVLGRTATDSVAREWVVKRTGS